MAGTLTGGRCQTKMQLSLRLSFSSVLSELSSRVWIPMGLEDELEYSEELPSRGVGAGWSTSTRNSKGGNGDNNRMMRKVHVRSQEILMLLLKFSLGSHNQANTANCRTNYPGTFVSNHSVEAWTFSCLLNINWLKRQGLRYYM